MSIEREVGMGRAGEMWVALSEDSGVGQAVRGQFRPGEGARKRGASKRRRIGI